MKYDARLRYVQRRLSLDIDAPVVISLGLVTGIGLALRLLSLGKHSLWADEIISVTRAQQGWFEGGIHMAVYETLLRIWLLAGDSETTIRLLSVLFAVATFPALYALGRQLFSPWVGVTACLMLSMHAFHIQYSQEARAYSLLVLLICLSSLFFVRGVQNPTWRSWTAYVIMAVLAIYSHSFGSLVLLAHAASVPFLSRKEIPWKSLLASWAAILLFGDLIVFEAISHLMAGGGDGGGISWIPPVTTDAIYSFGIDLTGRGGAPLLMVYLLMVSATVIGLLWHWKRTNGSNQTSWRYVLLLAWLVLPITVTIAASMATPLFVPRYLIMCLPALVLLTAASLWHLTEVVRNRSVKIMAMVVVALIIGLSLKGTHEYYTQFTKEDWRGVTSFVVSRWEPGDALLFYMPWMEPKFRYYLDRAPAHGQELNFMVDEREWTNFIVHGERPDKEDIAQFLGTNPSRVWLIVGHANTDTRVNIRSQIESALSSGYADSSYVDFSKLEIIVFGKEDEGLPTSVKSSDNGNLSY